MGYQAVLFCPDEKLARVIIQVLNEVDFVVDTVIEPFAAVKKLMAQHYDAIVVDCDNDQNSALLFRSARNSSFNQSSLAIGVVEGQAGVAKAYRIGANLVLTKPINLEQCKGTLRVARGLLKKTADNPATASHAGAIPAKAAPVNSVATPPSKAPVAPPPMHTEMPHLASPTMASASAMGAAAMTAPPTAKEKPVEIPEPVSASAPHLAPEIASHAAATPVAAIGSVEHTLEEAAPIEPPKPARPVSSVTATPQMAAAAPAPAREALKLPELDTTAKEASQKKIAVDEAEPIPAQPAVSRSAPISDGPSFAALKLDDSEASQGSKKIFIIGIAIVSLAVAGYFGWTQLSQRKPSVAPVPAPTAPAQQSAPPSQPLPMSSPAPAPPPAAVERASAAVPSPSSKIPLTAASKPSASGSAERAAPGPKPQAQESPVAPIVVRQSTPAPKPAVEAEDAAGPPPSPLGVASPADSSLKGLMPSEANLAKPTLSLIKISQGVSQGMLIKSVPPKYPRAAVASHLQGDVQIEATITKEGNVLNPKVIKGGPILGEAALEAVRQWRYKPYYLDGQPVQVQTQITVKFKNE